MKTLSAYLFCLLLLAGCENGAIRKTGAPSAETTANQTPLDREIKNLMEKGISMEERRRQTAAVEAAFNRRTTPERARQLAALCFTKTLGTPFMPFDLAEIALAETGGNRLSGRAISCKGALGVWQLMPVRARSHGYTPEEMADDEKCAEAAVRELSAKLELAMGNMDTAKKLYCGKGPQANAYMKKIRQIRREMTAELARMPEQLAMGEPSAGSR
jgi:hypothetical protein